MIDNISNDFLVDAINEWNEQVVMLHGNPSAYIVSEQEAPDVAFTVRTVFDNGYSEKEAISIGLCIVISNRITNQGIYNCPIEPLILILTMLAMFDTEAFDSSEHVKQELRQHDEDYTKQILT